MNKKLLQWGLKNEKGRRVEGEKVRRSKMRLKASIPSVQSTFHQLNDNRHFDAFADVSVNLKKPSGGRRALWVPHAMGPLAAGGKND